MKPKEINKMFYCGKCNKWIDNHKWNFCPNCGEKIDKE